MNLGRLNHVGVATPSIERSIDIYRTLLGADAIGVASRFSSCATLNQRVLGSSPSASTKTFK